ncbi:hypothetical protein [Sphingomonas ursincola]|uniref:Uncharacterized protein n=1 Tax=Sphingomonas ursincola TaxID=56361 RepID=A0A7V8RCG3_9SPHN|nr:hypothetical protein [Sphingomonas ursincola]MBA1373917.1 hypothetical protein [Sphingomonas ursincola]
MLFLAMTACNPSGMNEQALATVDGSEITYRDVNENLGDYAADPAWRTDPAKLNLTLESLVQRRLLAQEARHQDLEKDATFHFAMRRAEELLLIEALQRKLAKKLGKPDPAKVSAYIRRQPWRFADRYRLVLDDGTMRSELDSFTLSPDNSLLAKTEVGKEIVIKGRSWTVVGRVKDPIDPVDARKLAEDEIVQRQVRNSLAALERQRRRQSLVRYRTGWGPAGQ